MTDRDVLTEARELLDEATGRYGPSVVPNWVAVTRGLADDLAESRAEVERERAYGETQVLRVCSEVGEANRVIDQLAAERDEALAAIERVREWYGTVRDVLTSREQQEFDRALDGGERDE